ncbi:hypothetical protein [Spirosoma rhododendri]|uniref:Uncharacterized protein n=1 Tax=Spirosoma rhododendri TaxID=2728024 RepID=A0A7L5DY06_9BACT|nr:hypothetical protein [Spirosoma rhododendri]QJD81518.1 hypothetical protein HH216_24410 [Spirosoma rhododendri]
MPNPLLGSTAPADSTLIRHHLDHHQTRLVVFDDHDPHRLPSLKAYASEGYLPTKRSIRHKVIHTLLGDETQLTEHQLADLRLYQGL